MSNARSLKFPMHSRGERNIRILCAATLGAILITSCATQELRSYPTPKTLCGTSIPSRVIEPILPPGNSIAQDLDERKEPSERYSFCRINVDGQKILSFTKEWYPRDSKVIQLATEPRGTRLAKYVADDGSYVYAERGGVSSVPCRKPATEWKREQGKLFVVVRTSDPIQPNESAMKNLVTGYAKAVSASSECN
ncbi:hypothetical protein [Streptomyces sp. NPDC058657]|uniref:hypothetical protein n=1 Tax=unclassified Streptomyces TaxID=2593676 RepID=UPI0036640674